MTEKISWNPSSARQNSIEQPVTQSAQYARRTITPDEYWRREKRKNTGLVERLYNKIKNLTGLGIGTKKVEKELNKLKKGEISQKDFAQKVQDYSSSQEASARLIGDAVTIGSTIPAFFFLHKHGKMLNAKLNLNKGKDIAEDIVLPIGEKLKDKVINICKSNKKLLVAITGLAALNAGFTNQAFHMINRIGSQEYKVDEKLYGKKKQRTDYQEFLAKESKRRNRKEKFKQDWKNFASGAVNGLMLPIVTLGGWIGAPLYLFATGFTRTSIANKPKNPGTETNFMNEFTRDIGLTSLVGLGLAIPLVKKGEFTKVFNQNLNKTVEKLSKATLKRPDYAHKSALSQLEETLYKDSKISKIVTDESISVEEQIKKLTDENIFAVKFKQISSDQSILTNALREKCPPTRTISEAQKYVDSKIGSGYKISKLLGVGTIAETYLAKSPDGKEVCLKILKNGISEQKILNDKQKFVDMVKNLPKHSQEEKNYLIRNIDDLSDGILKEIDFKNEMEAAKKLVPYTKVANVVKPIDVKNGVYIMEKAEGISLSSLVDLNEAKLYREGLIKNTFMQDVCKPQKGTKLYYELLNKKTKNEQIKALDDYIARVESRTPQFNDININKKDVDYLLNEYIKVLVEQFNKVDKNGKVLHADIHPGNIFIDMNALKARKGKIFTLIDTGNTIEQNAQQAMRAINLTSYVKRADVPDLTEYVLEGAILPKGMTHEQAVEKISSELKKSFFDNETSLDKMTNETVLTLSSNIMNKYGIIPSDTQLNFNKAVRSASNSLHDMLTTLVKIRVKDVNGPLALANFFGGVTKDTFLFVRKYKNLISKQEQLNLKELPASEQLKFKNNKNLLETNSEEYLTYKLKQSIKNEPDVGFLPEA